MFGHPASSGHPSHCRPARCCLTFFFECLTLHRRPSKCRPGTVPLDFVFGCPVFRRSLIPLPIELGAALPISLIVSSGGHPSKSRPGLVLLDFIFGCPFPAVTHPTADRARCCLTLFFDCLLFRPSPIHVPIRPGDTGLHLQLSRFQRSPIPLLTEPVLLDLFLRLSPLQVVTHMSADLSWCCWTSSSAIPFHPLRTEPGAA